MEATQPDRLPGVKLMTVFVFVLALHVLVIGGFAVCEMLGFMDDAPAQDRPASNHS